MTPQQGKDEMKTVNRYALFCITDHEASGGWSDFVAFADNVEVTESMYLDWQAGHDSRFVHRFKEGSSAHVVDLHTGVVVKTYERPRCER